MSDLRSAKSRAGELETQASAWLEQKSSGVWSDADQEKLELWRSQSPLHEVTFLRLESAWRFADRLTALGNPDTIKAAGPRRHPLTPVLLRMAAVLAIVIAAGAGALALLPQPHDRTFSTRLGGHETIAFADGSKIELNTDTVVRVRMTTHERTIWLDKGEAFFEVRHDPAHPFIVLAGGHRITDLGTKFFVRRDPGKLEVALLEGRVRFGTGSGERKSSGTLLTPDETVVATGSTIFVTRKSASELSNELSWRRGQLIFKHTTLADAANEFNRYNREKLLIADPEIAQLRVYGTFQTTNVRAFTEAVRKIFGLRMQSDGDEIVISR